VRVVYTTHQFFPDFGAGTEVLTLGTAKEMARRGHAVEIYTGHPVREKPSPETAFDAYRHDGLPVCRMAHANRWSILPENPMEAEYRNLFFARRFRRDLAERRPDVAHFFHLQRVSASAVEVCYGLGIPTVFTVTDFWPLCPTNQLLGPGLSLCRGPGPEAANCVAHLAEIHGGRRVGRLVQVLPPKGLEVLCRFSGKLPSPPRGFPALVRALGGRAAYLREQMNRVDAVLVATGFMEETLVEFGVDRGRIRRVPFGIPGTGKTGRKTVRGRRKNLRIGFIGTLYEHKGAHVLLRAVRRLPADLPVEVRVYGKIDYFPAYGRRLVALAGEDRRVCFCGTFPGEMTGEVLDGLDLLVVPSLWYENAPLVILEARRAGVPVVATGLGGMSELIRDGEDGMLFDRGDDGQLARILEDLCRDRDRLARMSRKAPPPGTIVSYADEVEKIYRSLADRRKGPAARPGASALP